MASPLVAAALAGETASLDISIRPLSQAGIRRGASLRHRLMLAFGATTVIVGSLTFLALREKVRSQNDITARDQILSTQRAVESLIDTQYLHLSSASELIADAPRLKAAVETGDARTVQEDVGGFREAGRADLLAVVSAKRELLALLGTASGAKLDVNALPGIDASLAGETGRGVLRLGPDLFLTASAPMHVEGKTTGAVLLGLRLDDAFAGRIKSVAQVDVTFVSGKDRLASSLSASDWEAVRGEALGQVGLVRELRAEGKRAPGASGIGTHMLGVTGRFDVGAAATPLTYVLVRDLDALDAQLAVFVAALLAGAVGVMVLVILISHLLSGRIIRGLGVLVAAANEMAQGNFHPDLKIDAKDEVAYVAHCMEELSRSVARQIERLRTANDSLRGKIEDILFSETLGDRYQDVEVLARGGMGIVYRAHDPVHGRDVAIKILSPMLVEESDVVQRFLREAEILKTLDHPAIIKVHEGGRTKLPFLEMEYFPGRSVQETVDSDGPLPWRDALVIARETLSALAYLHDRGVLHRDVKPANVLMDETGQARVVDFGIARDASFAQLTRTGDAMGSPAWAAPEVFSRGTSDARSDLFGWGLTLFFMLTGVNAASLPAAERSLLAIWHSGLPPSPPASLDHVLREVLDPEPGNRPADARRVLERLEQVAGKPPG